MTFPCSSVRLLFIQALVGFLWINSCRAATQFYSSSVLCQQNTTVLAKSGCVNGELDLLDQQMLVSFNQVYNQYGLIGKSWKEAYKYPNQQGRSLGPTCRDYCGPKGNPIYCAIYCGGSYRRRRSLLRMTGRELGKYDNNGSPNSAHYNATSSSSDYTISSTDDDFCQSVDDGLIAAALATLKDVMALTTSKACQSFLQGVICQANTAAT